MKILGVRCRNLNSLAGSWAIDFTAPEYADAGIFAITGPTGSGKSTILDAICLALFARTPRLGHVSKGSNEIMSRRTGDCFAEVDFETDQGRYRCHWSQRRARFTPEGELQQPRHELVDARTDMVLESRAREVVRRVEDVTGMDYDRFTRSMLLAQGGFAAFLEADADQRAPILEQITGTGIYSDISVAAHKRLTEEQRATQVLEEALAGLTLLDDEAEQALLRGLDQAERRTASLRQRLTDLDQALQRARSIAGLKEQINRTEQEHQAWQQRKDRETGRLLQLERGMRAQALAGLHARWLDLRARIAELDRVIATLQAGWAAKQEEWTRLGLSLEQARLALRQAQERQESEGELIKQVRNLDLQRHQDRMALDQIRAEIRQAEEERTGRLAHQNAMAAEMVEMTSRQRQVDDFFRAHPRDGLLVEQLAGIEERVRRLAEMAAERDQLNKALVTAEAILVEAETARGRLVLAMEKAEQILDDARQRKTNLEQTAIELLAGRTLSALRAEVEMMNGQLRHLVGMRDLLDLRRQHQEDETASTAKRLRLQAHREQISAVRDRLETDRHAALERFALAEQKQRQATRQQAYAEDRPLLIPGSPCPLCGSPDHPYASQQPPLDEVAQTLAGEREHLDRLQAEIASHREMLVGLDKDIEYADKSLQANQHQLRQCTDRLSSLLAGFGVDTPLAELENWLTNQHQEAEQRLARLQRDMAALEQGEEAVRQAARRLETAQADHTGLRQQLQEAVHGCQSATAETRRLRAERATAREKCTAAWAAVGQTLAALGLPPASPDQTESLLAELANRRQRYLMQQEQREALARRAIALQAEQEREAALLAALGKTLADLGEKQTLLQTQDHQRLDQRLRLFADRDPDVEEQQQRALVREAEQHLANLGLRHAGLDKELHGLIERQRQAEEERAALRPRAEQTEAEFMAALPSAGFADPEAFAAAICPTEQLTELHRLKERLDREAMSLSTRQQELNVALRQSEAAQQGWPAEADLVTMRAEVGGELETLLQRLGADRERLAVNNGYKQEQRERQSALVRQRHELERWQQLHQLIGSADGKKFRVFAQGLTFDLMISHANRQLERMSDRYLLLRDPKTPLDLLVLDSYQAGETRSTRNLSGGESFVVSLALALGLSAMASHNVRVDSLFLDEGFGTLDQEALNMALQTLAELRRNGTLIGVISHVPLLRDRIDVHIRVLPGSDGCSRLAGPGVRRMD